LVENDYSGAGDFSRKENWSLTKQPMPYDDIIIVKNGLVTDAFAPKRGSSIRALKIRILHTHLAFGWIIDQCV
jgi:hypothetical protein